MSMSGEDWSITRSNGEIRYIGGDHDASPTYATVIEFHRWLQDFADDAVSSGDDEHDITDTTSSDRSTDNIITLQGGFNIDDNASEHLYDGSIIQLTGTEFYDGVVNFGNTGVQIQVLQDGSVISDDWWNFEGGGLNSDSAQGISHRFMVKTRSADADVDGRRLIGTSRTFGNTYSEFSINGTARGNNVFALTDTADLNNDTALADVSGWTGITNVKEGYSAIDVDNNSADEYYYSEWNTNQPTRTINNFYERMKYLTRDTSAETIYGLNGEVFRGITHQIVITPGAGTWVEPESVSWGSGATAGTGQLLAVDTVSGAATTKMCIQLLTGVIPNANLITGAGGGTGTASTITERSIASPFIGISTGSAIIGGYGVGIEKADLTSNDKVFDLNNAQVNPPNNVTFSVLGLVSGEDRVLVTNNLASNIDYAQMSLNTTLNATGELLVDVGTAGIPVETPATGTIRVELDDGRYRLVPYVSNDGDDGFTINATDFTNPDDATAGNNVFISYIDTLADSDTESVTVVYNAGRTLFVRVRDGGGTPIKTFESTSALGSNGGSATSIRTSDA